MPLISTALPGAVLLTFLWTQLLFWWGTPHPDMTAAGANVALDLLG
jgi:hypothetical protein